MRKLLLGLVAALSLGTGVASAATSNGQLFPPDAGYTQGGAQ